MKEYKTILTKEPVDLVESITDTRLAKAVEMLAYGMELRLNDSVIIRFAYSGKDGYVPVMLCGEHRDQVQGLPEMSIVCLSEALTEIPQLDWDCQVSQYAAARTITNLRSR